MLERNVMAADLACPPEYKLDTDRYGQINSQTEPNKSDQIRLLWHVQCL